MFHGNAIAHGKVKRAELRAVVTRADGSVEDLGIVTYYHRNPLKRWAWAVRQFLRGKKP